MKWQQTADDRLRQIDRWRRVFRVWTASAALVLLLIALWNFWMAYANWPAILSLCAGVFGLLVAVGHAYIAIRSADHPYAKIR